MALDVDRIAADLRQPAYRELTATLDYISQTLSGTVYIEDASGRLLFSQTGPSKDDWRSDFTPLSLPSVHGFERSLRIWSQSGRTYFAIPGDLSFRYRRAIIPLTYRGQIFAFAHLVNSRLPSSTHGQEDTASRLVAILGDKLFMLVMGQLNEFRHPELPQVPLTADEPVGCAVTTLATGIGEHPTDRILDHESAARSISLVLQDALTSPDSLVETVDSHIVRTADCLELVQELRFRQIPDRQLTGGSTAVGSLFQRTLNSLGWRLNLGLSVITDGTDRFSRAEAEARALVSMAPPDHEKTRVLTRGDGGLMSLARIKQGGASFNRYTEHIRSVLDAADPELALTAATYAMAECNSSDTAARLQVDRRTINHRLHRIAEITGLDLPSFPAKIILYLAFLPGTARSHETPM